MREELLQFIWRYQYFDQHELVTETGEKVEVLSPGRLNTNQGPDFLDAQARIGGVWLAGSIELHIVASDWIRHAHDADVHYRNVILHVVWENDWATPAIPTLVLRHRVAGSLLGQYGKWMKNDSFVPCERQLSRVDIGVWPGWNRQLLLQRLRRRTEVIGTFLDQNRQHWEETAWWWLARSFGLPVNSTAFEVIGRSLPLRLLARHRGEVFLLEALLLGQAGMLEGAFQSAYPRLLQKEFLHLRTVYRLPEIRIPLSFHRMRPGHFPSIRLAQLAVFLSAHPTWFAQLREAEESRHLLSLMAIVASKYWDYHYRLEVPSLRKPKRLGTVLQNSLLINAFIPLLFAYGHYRGECRAQERAIRWLEGLPPETSAVLRGWSGSGVTCKSAADSQALLQLKKEYCEPKKCLDCAVGQDLLAGKDPVRPE